MWTIPSLVRILKIVPLAPFQRFFFYPLVVSLHACADQHSAWPLKIFRALFFGTLALFPPSYSSTLSSLVSVLWILATSVSLNSQLRTLKSGRPPHLFNLLSEIIVRNWLLSGVWKLLFHIFASVFSYSIIASNGILKVSIFYDS